MHFHQKIHQFLLEYRDTHDSNFNFLVRQRTSVTDKNFPGGKFAHGLVFQGNNDYCFVALSDKSGGANATKSIGIVIRPTKSDTYTAMLEIVFPGEQDQKLIAFYKELASKFEGIKWDNKEERAWLQIGEFTLEDPTLLYNWLDKNYPIIRETALQSGIDKLIPDNKRFNNLQKKLKIKLKEASKHVDIFNYVKENNIVKKEASNKNNSGPLNQIFYGPPGTGKTYTLKRDFFPLYTTNETSITLDQHFESVVKECSWWEVIAIALLQSGKSKVNDIFNHKWVQKKAELSNSNTVKPTLWGQLQSHTVEECQYVNVKSKQQPLIFNKTEDSSWEILKDKVDNEVPELYELINKVENFNPSPDKEIKRYKFVTFHQSFSYEDFIEGIKPIMSDNTDMSEDLGYKIEDGIFKEICKDAALDPSNRYAIFIDEINRGNVSAIFGELITLIEKDKRKGAINEMSIELPYSKKKFSVPSNLDIYGTMNTADRSVEALDTALRRRFEFVEKMPDYKVIDHEEVYGVKLSKVLKVINKRIELLIDRDHTIGHSYFVGVDTPEKLTDAFNNKIIPLLQEYFYGDYGKIGLVLGKGFVETIKNDKITFADFSYENSEDFKMPSYNLKTINPENIIEALDQLLNNPVEEN